MWSQGRGTMAMFLLPPLSQGRSRCWACSPERSLAARSSLPRRPGRGRRLPSRRLWPSRLISLNHTRRPFQWLSPGRLSSPSRRWHRLVRRRRCLQTRPAPRASSRAVTPGRAERRSVPFPGSRARRSQRHLGFLRPGLRRGSALQRPQTGSRPATILRRPFSADASPCSACRRQAAQRPVGQRPVGQQRPGRPTSRTSFSNLPKPITVRSCRAIALHISANPPRC